MSSRQDYTRVPVQETIEMNGKGANDDFKQSSGASRGADGGELPASRSMVMFSVGFYLVAAIVMVIGNKYVLNAIEIPLFFLLFQLSIAVLLLHVFAIFGYFKLPHVSTGVCKGLAPLIGCNVLGLAFNTYCLQYVDASFYQVARGLVLPFTVFFSWVLLRTYSSPATLAAVATVCIGFLLGVASENIHASSVGIILGVASSVTTSVHAIVVKRSLPVVNNSTLDLVYYQNLLSAIVILPFVFLSGEVWMVTDMVTGVGASADAFKPFFVGAAVTGVFGFLICIAGFLSIKVTSPISHMISAAVRGVLQTFLGIWLFGDIVGGGRAAGIVFILGGSCFYVYTKSIEQVPPAKHSSSSSSSIAYAPVPTSNTLGKDGSLDVEEKENGGSGRTF